MRLSPDELRLVLVVCAIAFVSGGVGALVGALRGRAAFGFFLGLILGPLGWLFTMLMPDNRRQCPACRGPVHPEATRCRHCSAELPPILKRELRRVI